MKSMKQTIYGRSRSVWNLRVLGLVLALVGIMLTIIPITAAGATFVVNSTADTVDANPGNSVCADVSGQCTLRAAIMEANVLSGVDIITLPAGTYMLTIPGIGEDAAVIGDLDITADLTINGAGATTTIIDGAGLDRVFHVLAGTVTLSGVTIRNGTVSGFHPAGSGGGIYNQVTLTLNNSTVSSNTAGNAGGIRNDGTLTINNSAVSGNAVGSSDGGGIFNQGTLALINSTVSGNTAGFGGGIFAFLGGSATLKNTIIANNGGNCAVSGGGTFTSLGHNLSSDASCAFAGPGDINNTPAHLAPLALNVPGTTQTHALCTGAGAPDPSCVAASPAIDAVPLASCTVSTDQRGVARPQPAGGACDIGAYEVLAACVPPPSGMVSWWPLGEGAGATSLQDIIGGNNATLFASPLGAAQAPQPVSGTVNGAIHFPKFGNGLSGARVSPQGALAAVGSADFTIDAWVEFQSAPANRPHYIVNKFDTVQNKGYALYVISPGITGNERLEFKWGDGTNVSTVQTISTVTPGQFHYVAVTFARNVGGNALDIRLYVDGAQQGQQTGNPPGLGSLVNFVFLEIGQQPGTIDEPITIDELEIFNRALPQSDIQAIYNAGSAGKCKPCVPPPSNLAHWWPLDEAAGSTAHDITGGRDGATQVGAIGSPGSPNSAAGQVGTAFAFDGNSAFVTVPDGPGTLSFGNLGQEFSIDAWINVKSADASGVRPIVDKRNETGGRVAGYQLYLQNGNLSFQLADGIGLSVVCDVNPAAPSPGTSCTNYVSTANVADGQWHHVAVTVERTGAAPNVRLYVDGVLQFTGPTRIHANNNAALLIAKNNPAVSFSGQFFKGSIDELEIFSRVLNLADIQAIYDAPGGKCKKFVNLSITPTNPTTNPFDVTYAVRGCSGQEMFLVLDASAAPNAVPGLVPFPLSYLDTSGAWQPWPTPLSLITPWMSSGPADGLYTLFSGSVPTGQYTLYLGCDFVPNGHLDIDANLNVNGVYDALNVTVQ